MNTQFNNDPLIPANPFAVADSPAASENNLTFQDIETYIQKRLNSDKHRYNVDFSFKAIHHIHHFTAGNLKLVNTLCGWVFLLALRDSTHRIDLNLVNEAAFRSSLLEAPGQEVGIIGFPKGQSAIEFLEQEHRIRQPAKESFLKGLHEDAHPRKFENDDDGMSEFLEDDTIDESESCIIEASHESVKANTGLNSDKFVSDLASLGPVEGIGKKTGFGNHTSETNLGKRAGGLHRLRAIAAAAVLFVFIAITVMVVNDFGVYPTIKSKLDAAGKKILEMVNLERFTGSREDGGTSERMVKAGSKETSLMQDHDESLQTAARQNAANEPIYETQPGFNENAARDEAPLVFGGDDESVIQNERSPVSKPLSESGTDDPQSGLPSEPSTASDSSDERMRELQEKAERQLKEQKLTTPEDDNALDTYKIMLKIEPGYLSALAGITEIKETYSRWGLKAWEKQDWATAKNYYEKVLSIDPEDKNTKIRLNTIEQRIKTESTNHVTEVEQTNQQQFSEPDQPTKDQPLVMPTLPSPDTQSVKHQAPLVQSSPDDTPPQHWTPGDIVNWVLHTNWYHNAMPVDYLPSQIAKCLNSRLDEVICFSQETRRKIGSKKLTYMTKSTLSGFDSSRGQFKVSYLFNVTDMEETKTDALPEETYGLQLRTGWQEPGQTAVCQAQGPKTLVCQQGNATFEFVGKQ